MKLRTAPVVALAAVAVAPAAAGATAAQDPRIPLPDGWQPEGIAAAPGGNLYVGSLATGDVLRLDPRTGRTRTVVDAADGAKANGIARDGRGHLFVAGNDTGNAYVYREKTGALDSATRLTPPGEESFVNDVAYARGSAYFTDSSRPFLYVVRLRSGGGPNDYAARPVTGVDYGEGINLNGIVDGPGGRSLYAVQSNTGKLFRFGLGSRAATAVDTGGYALTNGDGIERRGRRLYVVQNRANTVAVLRLSADGRSAKLVRRVRSKDVDVPTTAAFLGRRLFAVNARFGNATPDTAKYWVTRLGRQ